MSGKPLGGKGLAPVDDDDDEKDKSSGKKTQKEFDCPSCSANNPVETPLADGDEVLCNYCGAEFKVRVADDGRVKLKEM